MRGDRRVASLDYWVSAILLLGACTGHSAPVGREPPAEVATLSHESDPKPARPNTTTFTRTAGGSATTKLGYGISVNPKTSLMREWITAKDTTLPVQLEGSVGVKTVYSSGGASSSGGYRYVASVPIVAKDSIAALELRIVLFDIWGDFVKTLTETEVEDIAAGQKRVFSPSWSIWDESEVSEHYASIAYISRVRAMGGRVYEANFDPIVTEAQKISDRFSPADLDPKRRTERDSSASLKRP